MISYLNKLKEFYVAVRNILCLVQELKEKSLLYKSIRCRTDWYQNCVKTQLNVIFCISDSYWSGALFSLHELIFILDKNYFDTYNTFMMDFFIKFWMYLCLRSLTMSKSVSCRCAQDMMDCI